MTREEAKEILTHNWTRVDNPNYSESELDEAFFMAIEALSADTVQGFRGGKIPPKEMLDGTVLIPQHQWLEMERELAELKSNFESAVTVVRCKDCRHKVVTKDGEYNEEDIVCDYWLSDGLDSNDFCSYGERKK